MTALRRAVDRLQLGREPKFNFGNLDTSVPPCSTDRHASASDGQTLASDGSALLLLAEDPIDVEGAVEHTHHVDPPSTGS